MKNIYIALTCLVFAFASLPTHASYRIIDPNNDIQEYFRVAGSVLSGSQAPVANASIMIRELQKGTVTDSNGNYVFEQVPTGNYTIEVRYVGKKMVSKKITVNDNSIFDIVLYNENEELEEVTLEGQTKNKFEASKETSSVGKMPLRAIETPQVYTSIDGEVLKNQFIFTVDDAYRNITGLQKMWSATNRAGDGGAFVNLRGFIVNNPLRNGLVAPVTTTIDAINIEKLEVLKGPSATLFGSNVTSYGGIINRVTKKPNENFGGEVAVAGGSNNYYRAQADINTPLTNDKKLLFRVNTAYTNSGNFQKKDAENSFLVFIPSLTYKFTENLDVNLEFEMLDTDAVPDQFLFYLSPALGVDNIEAIEDWGLDYKNSYMGDGLKTKSKTRNLYGAINYTISDHIKSSTNINSSYSQSNGYNPYFYIAPESTFTQDPADTEMGVIRSDQSTVDSKQKYFQVQQNFNFDFHLFNMRNRTAAGFDYLRREDEQMFIFLSAFDWVPFAGGNYDSLNAESLETTYETLRNTPGYDFDANNTYPITGVLNTYSGYISNVLTPVPGLNVLTSLRYESNNFEGGKSGQAATPEYTQGAWSPKFGLVYELVKDKVSVFGNYQNSFTSNGYILTSSDGEFVLSDPERANQWEGGFKTNLMDGRVNATISYYNIDVKNSLLNTGEYVGAQAVQKQSGSLTSKGVEFEVSAFLAKGFSLIAGTSYNDSRYTSKDELDADVYNRRPTTASSPWLTNFNASYRFMDGKLEGLGFGAGGNYASDNKIVNSNSQGVFILPSYFVLNANAYYDIHKFRFSIKADNLTDAHYWTGYTTANPQSLLSVVGGITYRL
ncbi:TonB-dependent receptor [Galbibacter sp. PAP.153]|uniref:TonB-dependent receptor n=1 Tax=Galbibacter sp. PAP.153 TaxID=3104623 RepID=UPI003009817C